MSRAPKSKRTKISAAAFSDTDKILLANQVETYRCLWDKNDDAFKRCDLQLNCWKEVPAQLNKSVSECKAAWKSMKDALRYRKISKIQGKSGDAALLESEDGTSKDESFNPDAFDGWKLWECMKFYAEATSTNYKTVSSIAKQGDPTEVSPNTNNSPVFVDVMDTHSEATNEKTESNYSASNHAPQSKKRKQPDEAPVDKLCEGITDLIKLRKMQADQPKSTLKYMSMYANLDRMLSTLPEDSVEDLNLQFITLARAAMKASK